MIENNVNDFIIEIITNHFVAKNMANDLTIDILLMILLHKIWFMILSYKKSLRMFFPEKRLMFYSRNITKDWVWFG